ncbi:MAG: DUF3105 domain-containing protein [Actinomycetota bacterium]
MAKRKRRRKKWSPPAALAAPEEASARQAKKDLARQQREQLIRRARRRVWLRRAAIVGMLAAIGGGVTAFIFVQGAADREREQKAAAAAARIGCGEVQELQSEGQNHVETPPTYATQPANSGPHFSSPLPRDVPVYEQAFDPSLEFRAVHNFEHGYVLMYYRADAEGVEQDVVDALTEIAESEVEVILAPHPSLADGTNVAFAAWTRLQECSVDDAVDIDDLKLVADGFIAKYRNASTAPEPSAP